MRGGKLRIHIMKQNFGFTLIEVAIVMVIIGLALAASIAPLSSQIERSKIAETEVILNDVMEALYGFAIANGRLPCPASAISLGVEAPAGGGAICTGATVPAGAHGFVPGITLGLSGKYNEDELLLDAWSNPIRYSVTQTDNDTDNTTTPTAPATTIPDGTMDFTSVAQIQAVGIDDLRPNLFICSRFSPPLPPPPETCLPAPPINNTLANNAVVIVMSLGEDGALPVTGADQIENSSEATLVAAAPPAGTGRTYPIGAERVFVSRSYKNTTTGTGVYKHQIKWMSPNTLYAKMIAAGQLP